MNHSKSLMCCVVFLMFALAGRVAAQPVDGTKAAAAQVASLSDCARYLPPETDTVFVLRPARLASSGLINRLKADGGLVLFDTIAGDFMGYTGVPVPRTSLWLGGIVPTESGASQIYEVIVSSDPLDSRDILSRRGVQWEEVGEGEGRYFRSIDDADYYSRPELLGAGGLLDTGRVRAVFFPAPNVAVISTDALVSTGFKTGNNPAWQKQLEEIPHDADAALLAADSGIARVTGIAAPLFARHEIALPDEWNSNVQFMRMAASVDGGSHFKLDLEFADVASAEGAATWLRTTADDAKQVLLAEFESMVRSVGEDAWPAFITALDNLRITTDDTSVTAGIPRHQPLIGTVLEPALRLIGQQWEVSSLSLPQRKLRYVAVYCHEHTDLRRSMPVAEEVDGVKARDANGRPFLSWRVHLLPVMGEEDLFKEFRLDEPWNSEHNIKLLPRMPDAFRINATLKPGMSDIIAPFGERTAMGSAKSLSFQDFLDGSSNTVLLFHGSPDAAAPWTKPDDFEFDPTEANAFDRFGDPVKNYFTLALCDAAVASFRRDIKPREMSAVIDYADGDVIDLRSLQADAQDIATAVPPATLNALRSTLATGNSLMQALKAYQLDMGSSPLTLDDLIVEPNGDANQRRRWRGPYLDTPEIPLDGWNNPFVFALDVEGWIRIESAGPDELIGTNDDLVTR